MRCAALPLGHKVACAIAQQPQRHEEPVGKAAAGTSAGRAQRGGWPRGLGGVGVDRIQRLIPSYAIVGRRGCRWWYRTSRGGGGGGGGFDRGRRHGRRDIFRPVVAVVVLVRDNVGIAVAVLDQLFVGLAPLRRRVVRGACHGAVRSVKTGRRRSRTARSLSHRAARVTARACASEGRMALRPRALSKDAHGVFFLRVFSLPVVFLLSVAFFSLARGVGCVSFSLARALSFFLSLSFSLARALSLSLFHSLSLSLARSRTLSLAVSSWIGTRCCLATASAEEFFFFGSFLGRPLAC